jgi:hypothetical protein
LDHDELWINVVDAWAGAWAVLVTGSAYGTHALADGHDQPWRKLLASLVAMALGTATIRPLEPPLLRLSKDRVAA